MTLTRERTKKLESLYGAATRVEIGFAFEQRAHIVDQARVDLFLRIEVVIQAAFDDACCLCDVTQLGAGETLAPYDFHGDLKDFFIA
jgi:hypothetical protein